MSALPPPAASTGDHAHRADDRARVYLERIRPAVSLAIGAVAFAVWAATSEAQYLRAGWVAIGGTVAAVVLVAFARRFGAARVARASAYVDLAFVTSFALQIEDIDVLSVAYLWLVLVAATFGSRRDAVVVSAASIAFAIALPYRGTDPELGPVVVEVATLAIAAAAVSAVGWLAARALRERSALEHQLREAQRIAGLGSFEFDPVTDVARWSDEMHRIFGAEDREPLGREAFLEAIVPEDRERVIAAQEAQFRTGEDTEFHARIRRPDGEVRAVHAIGTMVRSGDRVRILGTVQDVTELRRLDAMRDEFVAAASHELRTPAAIVLGFAATLTAQWSTLSDDDRLRFVGEIESAAQRLTLLIEDVLQVTQIESGNLHCASEPFDLRHEVAELVRTWPGALDVHLEGAEDGPIVALADPARTRQVLVNLLENAERHVGADARVRVVLGRRDGAVRAQVVDDGPGIPRDAQARIFDRFARLGSSSTGTGLGLYISRRLAEAQGGSLEVESEPGQGATFTFALPADPGRVEA